MLKQLLLVGVGGGIGSILRYLTSYCTAKYYVGAFPLGTFLVNLLGCFLIGILAAIIGHHITANDNLKLLLITGFCGGYTTFSAFAIENFNLINQNQLLIAVIYISLSIVLGILAVWLGITSVNTIIIK